MQKSTVVTLLMLLLGCSGQKNSADAAQPAPAKSSAEAAQPPPTARTSTPAPKKSTKQDAQSNKALESEHDDMEGVTWFHAKNYQRSWKKFSQWTSVGLYFGWFEKPSSFGPLRLKATYHGEDWTHAQALIIKVDDNDAVSFDISEDRSTNVSNGVWERYDVALQEKDKDCFDSGYSLYDLDFCKRSRQRYEYGPRLDSFCSPAMMSAKKVKVRFSGERAYQFNLPPNQLEDIKVVCGAYLALVR